MGSVAEPWMKIIQFTSIKSPARTQKEKGTRGGEWILAGSISWQVRDEDMTGILCAFHARKSGMEFLNNTNNRAQKDNGNKKQQTKEKQQKTYGKKYGKINHVKLWEL